MDSFLGTSSISGSSVEEPWAIGGIGGRAAIWPQQRLLPSSCCPDRRRSSLSLPRSEFTDSILSVHPSDVLDMPVDPNEPTYCLCHQVSYGEMIGCDNPDVSVPGTHRAKRGGASLSVSDVRSARV